MRTGVANLPLHSGKAPAWLFQRMVKLSREIITLMVYEFGTRETLKKFSDPYWFQALGCVLGFDWHSSGVTTTVCGAVKEGLRGLQSELKLVVAGGKGAASRRTPDDIRQSAEIISLISDAEILVYNSKLSAKVDNTAVQDGYQLYHHTFLFNQEGDWTVVQQGMNDTNGWARRYHWYSPTLSSFINDPHAAVCADHRGNILLNMVAGEAESNRRAVAHLSKEKPEKIEAEAKNIIECNLTRRHPVTLGDLNPRYFHKILLKTYERQPKNFQSLLEIEGVGPKTIRALALIAELLYGTPISTRDPARYSFAHGGKDGYPYPVDRPNYDRSIEIMKRAVEQSRLGNQEITNAIKRLQHFYQF
ncbi:hypothetical protein RT761_01392 [Atribacter laminatus]|jgi:hypothetical protein|uniref:DUF763 domain-containing protein n=1 Tax=Atribacter laminatus TaxID=2847778 RepID=A0A7T1ALK6_ATRLM|nr:DUF763 domain-containing protein [Atribacter laminatus]QPM68178.1 hypothetical protein RT761_01392 [Atribacter laminatus]